MGDKYDLYKLYQKNGSLKRILNDEFMETYGEKMFDPEEHNNYNRRVQEEQ